MGAPLMLIINGVDIDKDYYCSLLADACGVTITIDYDNHYFEFLIRSKCKGDIHIRWDHVSAHRAEGFINELIKLTYACLPVCLIINPNIPYTKDEIGSMAQGIGDLAAELTHKFENELRLEIYNQVMKVLTQLIDK